MHTGTNTSYPWIVLSKSEFVKLRVTMQYNLAQTPINFTCFLIRTPPAGGCGVSRAFAPYLFQGGAGATSQLICTPASAH